jgi:excinuclease UvrABC ATPase subunit
MKSCDNCNGQKLRKESLSVFLEAPDLRYNIAHLRKLPIDQLIPFLEGFRSTTSESPLLIERITHPLLERAKTIQHL